MSKQEFVEKKRFVISKKMIGKGLLVKVTFKDGKVRKYDVDKVYKAAKPRLEAMNCWEKYGNYTSTTNLPSWAEDGEIK